MKAIGRGQRKRRDIGPGGLSVVSLAEARDQARYFRRVARAGRTPLTDRNRSRHLPTFAEIARLVYEQRKHAWKNSKHQAQWLKSLEIHVFPEVGDMGIDQVGTSDVLRVLSPIWIKTPATARRLKQRIGMIFDWAKAAGHCTPFK